ncbi:MAG: ACT domain-containing protein [Clostridia bacterium]|nr:ACT domain-containing protein [Clostridia bacterium]
MRLEVIDGEFSVSKLADTKTVDITAPFTFLSVTDDEVSLVCRTSSLPSNVTHTENGWRMLRIVGELDFSLVGILADITRIFAEAGVGIFAVSTYNTDYVLCKKEAFQIALDSLEKNGYDVL